MMEIGVRSAWRSMGTVIAWDLMQAAWWLQSRRLPRSSAKTATTGVRGNATELAGMSHSTAAAAPRIRTTRAITLRR
jgi:hypothetical protein